MRRWLPLFALVAVALFVVVLGAQAREVCRPAPDGLTQDCREYAGIEGVAGAIFAAFVDWVGELLQGLADLAESMVVGLLPVAPDLDIPDMTGIVKGYSFLNGIFPLSEALAGGATILGAELAMFAFRLALTAWHIIPKPLAGT